jgi:hypothetical protein
VVLVPIGTRYADSNLILRGAYCCKLTGKDRGHMHRIVYKDINYKFNEVIWVGFLGNSGTAKLYKEFQVQFSENRRLSEVVSAKVALMFQQIQYPGDAICETVVLQEHFLHGKCKWI